MSEPLEPRDLEFLEKRRWFAARWNVIGTALLVGIGVSLGWMCWSHPGLVNPVHVGKQLDAGGISQPTLELMAVMLPLTLLMILGLLAVMIAFGFVVFGNERRYLKIIDRLRTVDGG